MPERSRHRSADAARLEGAIHWFERAVRCAPAKPRLHCNLGNAMRDAGRREDALPHFDRALALDPGLAEATIARAKVLDELGRTEDALTAYRHLEAFEPENLHVLLGLSAGFVLVAKQHRLRAHLPRAL
ncbi:unnamed protein product [Candidatus Paraburkholderia kirkii UZHbot1]|uniref:WGS project CAFE00000000 data, contig bkir_c105 n=1 Tax=Candidatus Paraburkholderia kirkii UZHbot1 TaxID=1055526 RepID=U3UAD1_9BURK|nr:unnamed protein product [Candidatus Paraburkholderia kirkii UZHbot1]